MTGICHCRSRSLTYSCRIVVTGIFRVACPAPHEASCAAAARGESRTFFFEQISFFHWPADFWTGHACQKVRVLNFKFWRILGTHTYKYHVLLLFRVRIYLPLTHNSLTEYKTKREVSHLPQHISLLTVPFQFVSCRKLSHLYQHAQKVASARRFVIFGPHQLHIESSSSRPHYHKKFSLISQHNTSNYIHSP